MKKIPHVLLIALLLCTLTVPSFTSAQVSSDDGGDGLGEQSSTWRHSNSQLQDRIEDLGDEEVDEFPIPVLFGVATRNLTRNFGAPRAGHTHEGLDIMAPEGTPIVSPVEAVVTRTGVWSGAGNYVSTAIAGGESLVYMHLSEIADIEVGDVLEVGDIIGYVGHTGNAIASAPHLHLEVRDEDGDATDPYPRITSVIDLDDKIEFLEKILDNHDDADELAELLVKNFKAEFTTAKAQNIDLPNEIDGALAKLPASSTPTVNGSTTIILKVGSRGDAVITLQNALKTKGYSVGVIDGIFGQMTRGAVVAYQSANGLVADGVAGPKTLGKIYSN